MLRAQSRFAEAIPEYETVLAFNRNYVFAIVALARCKLLTGSIEDTIPLVERAIRLSPRDPAIGLYYQLIGLVHLLQLRADEATIWLEKARNVTTFRHTQTPTPTSLRRTLSTAKPNSQPSNSPKPAG